MMVRFKTLILMVALVLLVACGGQTTPAAPVVEEPAATGVGESAAAPAAEAVDLAAVRQYTLDNAAEMKVGSAALAATAQEYYDLMATHNFDYEAAWAVNSVELSELVARAKTNWQQASQYYELDEGIIAGVPSLAFYDVWIDAGPSAVEDPTEAYQWTLDLPDGRQLASPGNFFHSLLEPTIWGTNPAFRGLEADLDGDGTIAIGEALPEANMLLGASQGLDRATAEMITAVEEWEPTLNDAFTALVVMIPTMNEYFEQWKLSSYIAGEAAEEQAFVGFSRLFDISGILTGLDFTYGNVSPLVEESDAALHGQIVDGFADLRGYVDDLFAQEQAGTRFTAEQADLFGTEAQSKATALSGQVSQAAALLNVEIEE